MYKAEHARHACMQAFVTHVCVYRVYITCILILVSYVYHGGVVHTQHMFRKCEELCHDSIVMIMKPQVF